MSYKYAVICFEKERICLKGYPRKLITYAKMFRKIEKAKEFQKTYYKPYPKIYELIEG